MKKSKTSFRNTEGTDLPETSESPHSCNSANTVLLPLGLWSQCLFNSKSENSFGGFGMFAIYVAMKDIGPPELAKSLMYLY